MSALVERIISSRDNLKKLDIADYAMIREARDAMADAANAITQRDEELHYLRQRPKVSPMALEGARKAVAAWDRYDPNISHGDTINQAIAMAKAIHDILSDSQ